MRFESPQTTKEAADLLASAKGKGRVLAGGTDLLVQMKSGLAAPELIVDIKRIPAVKAIKAEKGGLRVGAAVSGAELGENKAACKGWPGVVEAAELIGSTQIQGRASLAGNLCNASPAADAVPAMVAVGAKARVVGSKKRRDVLVENIPTGPGKTALAKDEVIESILLPKQPPRSGNAYLRFIPRTEMDIAVVGAAVSLTLDTKGVCKDAKVVLGAVGPRIIDAKEAAKALIGTKVDKAALKKAEEAAAAAAKPIDDKRGTKDFRKHVAGVLTRRAAEIALKRAKGSK